MNRRDFLRKSSLIISGATISQFGGLNQLFAATPDFSFNIITNQPEKATDLFEKLIKDSDLAGMTIKFSETQISGTHVGDVAFIRSNQLIDFRHSDDRFLQQIHEFSKVLALPQLVENPVLLTFSAENNSTQPQYVNIFRGDILVHRLKIEAEMETRVEGTKGKVIVSIKNGRAKIMATDCEHKTCIKMGRIHKAGQNLVCIPNQVRVAIEGKNCLGVDSVTH